MLAIQLRAAQSTNSDASTHWRNDKLTPPWKPTCKWSPHLANACLLQKTTLFHWPSNVIPWSPMSGRKCLLTPVMECLPHSSVGNHLVCLSFTHVNTNHLKNTTLTPAIVASYCQTTLILPRLLKHESKQETLLWLEFQDHLAFSENLLNWVSLNKHNTPL